MDKQKSIAVLQGYATGLVAQSFQHKVEGKIFGSQGFEKLAEKYADHAAEEMEWVDKFIERIIDLGGTPAVAAAPEMPVTNDPVEYIKSDLAVSEREVPILQQLTTTFADDFKTYDLLRAYALDEEEDMYWSQEQLDLIQKIGLANWLTKQL